MYEVKKSVCEHGADIPGEDERFIRTCYICKSWSKFDFVATEKKRKMIHE